MAEITPEIQAQLDEQKKNCPFCKIIAGEIESNGIYEDESIKVILDINPWIKGHMLIMPKEHYPIMPFIPAETFRHMFGLVPKLIDAVKKSMLTTGANVLIANGGVAGQQSPHFLFHLIPREKGDQIFDRFLLDDDRNIEKEKNSQLKEALAKNIPIMMQNHFSRNPSSWHTGNINTPSFLESRQKIYEDEKALVAMPENPQCLGHLVVYSSEEEKYFENLDVESASHVFYVASFCATAVFEGLGAQGSNIILKTGESDDNPDALLEIHILPRYPEDGIDVIPEPLKEKPNPEQVASKIKDETFMIAHEQKEEKKEEVINLDERKIEVICENNYGDNNPDETDDDSGNIKEDDNEDSIGNNPEDEISLAIRKLKETK